MKKLKKHNLTKTAVFAGAAALLTLIPNVNAQSSDALLDKLVDKGILTVKEAQELRDESDKNFNQALQVKNGMPDWVSALKFNGDIRARYENFSGENPLFQDRNRFRYRVRFGVVATFADDLEAGFKLTTSDVASGGANNEGDPISGNTTFQNNGSKKLIYIDQAYGKWSPLKGPDFTGSLTVGKMENPFVFSDMVFDPDYTPEGAAIQLGYQINDKHSVKFNGGAFVIDELAANANDPYMLGAQVRWDAAWTPKLSTSMGLAWLDLMNSAYITNSTIPNINRGNTHSAAGGWVYKYHPIVADASATYMLDSFPLYPGAFPIKVGGEYMYNPGAPSSADNYAYSAGVTFGKAGKKKTWEFAYTYKFLGADSWFEEVVDSDFGAFYSAANSPANSGAGIGYGAGTNVKGHILRLSYSPFDAVTLSAKVFLTDLITRYPNNSNSGMTRLQVDAQWKF